MPEPEAIYAWMPPEERLARTRENQGPVPRRVRPCDKPAVQLSGEEQAELAGLQPEARLTRYREFQARRE